jgi:hypothetical protein
MTTLKQLKAKYSGQAVPEWELVAAGLKEPPADEAPKKKAKPKVEEPVPDSEGE